jgi:HNH endonuclease
MRTYVLPSKERYQQIIEERRKRLIELGWSKKKRPRRYDSLEHQLMHNVCIDPNSGCWLWTLALNNGGYGFISFTDSAEVRHDNELAHRMSYQEFKGPIPEGKDVAHTCDCTYCINPAHLWDATPAENTQDSIAKGRYVFNAGLYHCGRKKGSKNRRPMTEEARANLRAGWERRRQRLKAA